MKISNRILIADDSMFTHAILKKGISDLPYKLVFAKDGREALNEIQAGPFDLLLLDVLMPKFTGFEVIKELQKKSPNFNVPFMFLTGSQDTEDISTGLSLGAVDYITKPFKLQEVRLKIINQHNLYKTLCELEKYSEHMESLAETRAQQLLHADRLSTLGTMAAGIMHEVNNPTTFISGNLQILKNNFMPIILEHMSKAPQDQKNTYIMEELPKMLNGMLNGVARITKITDGLKAFSRNNNEVWSKTDITQSINNAILFCKSSLPRSITVKTDLCELQSIMCDSQQIEQILMNLINNSGHALEGINNAVISIKSQLESEHVKITVSDNGPGIPQKTLEEIWKPFFTTKPSGKGTGLGLSICREIIQAHGGSLTYCGNDQGAAFAVLLPLEGTQ